MANSTIESPLKSGGRDEIETSPRFLCLCCTLHKWSFVKRTLWKYLQDSRERKEKMPLLDWEKTITCPYNPSHQITVERIQVLDTYVQNTCFSFYHETDHLFYQKNDDPWLLFFDKSACHVKSYAIFPSLVPPGEVQEEPRRLRSQGLSLNFAGEIIIISSLLWHFLKVCPFNASHHVPAPEVDFHVRTCSDRKVRLALFLKPASILTWCQGGGDGEVQLVDAASKAAWKLEVAGEWGLSCGKKTLDCLILLCLP